MSASALSRSMPWSHAASMASALRIVSFAGFASSNSTGVSRAAASETRSCWIAAKLATSCFGRASSRASMRLAR